MSLEFSEVNPEPLRKLYDAYSFNVIPAVGAQCTQSLQCRTTRKYSRACSIDVPLQHTHAWSAAEYFISLPISEPMRRDCDYPAVQGRWSRGNASRTNTWWRASGASQSKSGVQLSPMSQLARRALSTERSAPSDILRCASDEPHALRRGSVGARHAAFRLSDNRPVRFGSAPTFASMLTEAGFCEVTYRPLVRAQSACEAPTTMLSHRH